MCDGPKKNAESPLYHIPAVFPSTVGMHCFSSGSESQKASVGEDVLAVQCYSGSVCTGIENCLGHFYLLQRELVHLPDVRIDCGMISSIPG